MQKVVHPDVAGPSGTDMCMLLNEAYEVLSEPDKRKIYNEELATRRGRERRNQPVKVSTDLGPTWKWRPKRRNKEPVWTGEPRSYSRWHKAKPDDRGDKWEAQQFMYVDEFACISCRNCCDIAPKAFCIDIESGR